MKYVVFSNSINAWSIKKGLKKLDKELAVYSVNQKRNVINHNVTEIPRESTLFFTEENYLKKYINSQSHILYPNHFPKDLLDDKYKFSNFLNSMGELPIPYTSTEFPFEFPFFLKAKHSWVNDKKLTRGYICK